MASERFRCIAAFAVAVYLVGTGAVLNTSSSAADGSYSRRYSIADVAGNMNDSVRAAGYQEVGEGLAVLSATQRDFKLTPRTADNARRATGHATGQVRVLYAAPTDREFRSDYSRGIQNALVDFQSWLRRQLQGRTFSLYRMTPEQCRLSENADFYGRGDAWDKVLRGVQHCAPVREDTSDFAWVIYVDVDEACGEPHELGRGGPGLAIMPRWDLEGLANPGPYTECDEGPYDGPRGRWIGGFGHELGHALGLPHPPGCDEGSPTCDRDALMWLGYTSYPNTYLRDDEKEILLASPFIDRADEDEDPQDRAALMALYDATNGNNWTNSTNWGTDEPFGHWHGVRTDGVGRVVLLELQENNLMGPIPPELGRLSNMRTLDLHSNDLTGPIPPELGSLTNLENLYLWGNNLTGSIPPELGDLDNLKLLWVAHNNLSGSIPPELGSLTNLEGLWVAYNNLTGPLPSSMTSLGPLDHLHLENNAGLCAPADAAFQEWLATVHDFRGEICADVVEPKAPDDVEALFEALVAEAEGKRNAAAAGGRLRAGGHPVTIDMSTLFSFGAGGSAGTTYAARSSQPALVTADMTDSRLVLTPVVPARVTVTVTAAQAGDSAEVEFTVEVEAAAPSEVPAAPLVAQLLLALLLLGGGAYYHVRQAHHWAR